MASPRHAAGLKQWCDKAGISGLNTRGDLRFTDDNHAIQAAIAGHGVAIASLILLKDELSRGVLVQPFGPVLEGNSYHFVTTVENLACDDVQAVRSWLKEISME